MSLHRAHCSICLLQIPVVFSSRIQLKSEAVQLYNSIVLNILPVGIPVWKEFQLYLLQIWSIVAACFLECPLGHTRWSWAHPDKVVGPEYVAKSKSWCFETRLLWDKKGENCGNRPVSINLMDKGTFRLECMVHISYSQCALYHFREKWVLQ